MNWRKFLNTYRMMRHPFNGASVCEALSIAWREARAA